MKKKALVVLLAVAMIFCFASAAMAADYSDMGNATKATQDAVSRLSGLGVIDGYTDGTFGPNNNIRRDEFAKIATSAAGFASSADSMKNQATGYTDAAKGIWSTGYINIASAQGYMKGTGNNKFTPAANITNAEVLTTVLRMYGYNDNLTGPWPINYVNQAVKDGITDDVANFSSGATATRGDVAIMVSAALDQTMMEYSKDTESFQEKQYAVNNGAASSNATKKTLFEVAFGGEKAEKVKIKSVSVATYDAEDGLKYTITLYDKDNNAENDPTYECDANTTVTGAKFWALADNYATITYDKNDNAKSIVVTSSEVPFTSLEMTGANKVKVDGTTSYTLQKDLTIDKVFVDAATVKVENVGDKIKSSQLNENGTIKLDYDGKVYAITADVDKNAGTEPVVVSKVDTAKEKINLNGLSANQWKALDKTVIVKGGKVVAVSDLEVGDILTYKAADRVAVVADGISGQVGKNDGKKVTIGDKKYTMGATMDFVQVDGEDYGLSNDVAIDNTNDNLLITDEEGLYEKEVTIVKDGKNAIALVIYNKEASSKHYGVMMGAKTSDGNTQWGTADTVDSLTIYTTDGKSVTYNIDADYDINADLNSSQAGVQSDYTALFYGAPVKYFVNDDGEITDVAVLAQSDANLDVSNNKYVVLPSSNKAALASDVNILNLTSKDKKINVESITAAALLDGEEIELGTLELESGAALNNGKYFAYDTNKAGELCFVALTDFGGTTDKVTYAIVDAKSASKGTSYITFVGNDTEYKVADGSMATYADVKGGMVVSYKITGGKVSDLNIVGDELADVTTEVSKVNGTLINNSIELASDAKVFTWDADGEKFVVGEIGDIEEGGKVLTLGSTNGDGCYTNIMVVYANDVE